METWSSFVAAAMENTEKKLQKKMIQKMDALKENISPVLVNKDGNQVLSTEKRRYHLTITQAFDSFAKNLDLAASPIVRYFCYGSSMAGTFLLPDDPVTSFNDYSKYRTASTGSAGAGSFGFSSRGSLSVSPLSTLDHLKKVMKKVRSAVVPGITLKGDNDVLVMDGVQVKWKLGGRSALSCSASSSSSSGVALCKRKDSYGNFIDLRSAQYYAKNVAGGKKGKNRARKMGGMNQQQRIAHGLRSAELAMEGKKPTPPPRPPRPPRDPPRASKGRNPPVTQSRNWLPQDDGIEVVLPNFPTDKTPEREDVEAYIQGVLHDPNDKKRLSAFTSFCPI